jgi:hypothetical protein
MLRRVLQQVLHEYGNGRALDNTRRDVHRERFEHERIEALVRRLSESGRTSEGNAVEDDEARDGRPAA